MKLRHIRFVSNEKPSNMPKCDTYQRKGGIFNKEVCVYQDRCLTSSTLSYSEQLYICKRYYYGGMD